MSLQLQSCKYVIPDIMLWEVSDSFSKRDFVSKKGHIDDRSLVMSQCTSAGASLGNFEDKKSK